MINKQKIKKIIIILFLAQVVFLSGCASNKYDDRLRTSGEYSVTDRDILEFNNHVRHMLRLKMKYATISSYVASTIAMGAAVSATILSVGGAGAVTIAALAGVSAFSTNIMGIFSFSDVTKAYQAGVELIERSEARYLLAIARKGGSQAGVIDSKKLSVDAAHLYSETIGALALVEIAIASNIPTVEQVRQATGDVIRDTKNIADGNSDAFGAIQVIPPEVDLIRTGTNDPLTATITFKGDVPARNVTTIDPEIVEVSATTADPKNEYSAIITGKAIKHSTGTISVLSDKGGQTKVTVNISSPINIKLGGKERSTYTFEEGTDQTIKIDSKGDALSNGELTPENHQCKFKKTDDNTDTTLEKLIKKENNSKTANFIITCPTKKKLKLKITNIFKTIKEVEFDVIGKLPAP